MLLGHAIPDPSLPHFSTNISTTRITRIFFRSPSTPLKSATRQESLVMVEQQGSPSWQAHVSSASSSSHNPTLAHDTEGPRMRLPTEDPPWRVSPADVTRTPHASSRASSQQDQDIDERNGQLSSGQLQRCSSGECSHPEPVPCSATPQQTSTTGPSLLSTMIAASQESNDAAHGSAPFQHPPPQPPRPPWSVSSCIRRSDFGEAAVLMLFSLLTSFSLRQGAAALAVPPVLSQLLLAVSLAGVAAEALGLGDLNHLIRPRPGASPGLHLGAMALPTALLARAVLHSSHNSREDNPCCFLGVLFHAPCALTAMDLHCWTALAAAASALAATLSIRLSPGNGETAALAEGEAQAPQTAGEGSGAAKRGEALWPAFSAWAAASACVAGVAAACWAGTGGAGVGTGAAAGSVAGTRGLAGSGEGVGGVLEHSWQHLLVVVTSQPEHLVPALWVLALSLLCGISLLRIITLFPGSFTVGEAMLVSQGVTIYGGDALGMSLVKLVPGLHLYLPWGGVKVSSTGDKIQAIIQALVLGLLLLLPPAGEWIATVLKPAVTQAVLFLQESAGVTTEQVTDQGKSSEQPVHDGGEEAKHEALQADRPQTDRVGSITTARLLHWCKSSPAQASRALGYLSALLLIVLVLSPLWLHWAAGMPEHPVLWVLAHVLEDPRPRASLCLYWALTALLPLPLIAKAASNGVLPKILVRKLYHLMAVAMFVPAMLLQPGFLRLAFGVALCLFLVLEVLRVRRVEPLAGALDGFMRAFADSRDSGPIIISHFSLLLGCAVPLWLSPFWAMVPASGLQSRATSHLAQFAGILSIGIGDTMASVVGKWYGRHRIASNSPKTVEGTCAGILCTFCACALLVPLLWHFHGTGLPSPWEWLHLGVATTFMGLLEAYTEQLDNAFVPLIYFSILSI